MAAENRGLVLPQNSLHKPRMIQGISVYLTRHTRSLQQDKPDLLTYFCPWEEMLILPCFSPISSQTDKERKAS